QRADSPPFVVFRGKNITVYSGDFFDFTESVAGRFPLFYDRAALIALPAEMRPCYVDRLRSLVEKGGQGLLITLEYDPASMNGPPFAVTEAEVRRLFESSRCEKLSESDCLDQEPRFKARGLTWMKEATYRVIL